MTLDEKIQRYLSEAREQGVRDREAVAPIARLLCWFRVDAPPLLIWRPWWLASFFGIGFLIVVVPLLGYVFGQSWYEMRWIWPTSVIYGGLMTYFVRKRAKQLRLSPWWSPVVGAG